MLKSWDSCLQKGNILVTKITASTEKSKGCVIHLQICAWTPEIVWGFEARDSLILLFFSPLIHNPFSIFDVSCTYTNRYENIIYSMQNDCSKTSLICAAAPLATVQNSRHYEGTLMFVNWLQSSCSVPACGVNANLMANDWSSDQGSLMATYPWLSNAVWKELLGAAACQTYTPNY